VQFLRSTAELLAEHLRGAIERGELVEPLPPVHEWSARLGVSHGTLEKALQILKREDLIRTRPRMGIYLARPAPTRRRLQQPPTVRWIFSGLTWKKSPNVPEILGTVTQKLSEHGIRVSIDMLDGTRLKALHTRGELPHEMLVLSSFPREHQRLFSDFRRSALLLGAPFPGVELPYVLIDVLPALRHATFLLARRGFERITHVINEGRQQAPEEPFDRFCAEAPRPVRGDIVRLPDELLAQSVAAQRLAGRVSARHGLIVNSPIHAGLLMTALAGRGWKLGEEVEVIALNALPQEIRTCPVPIHYPYPLEAFSKAVCRAAIRYFEQGALPPLRKVIPLHMVAPPR
jgi:DNA-binding LacI/PurR family transcriptional regulator